jgi:O-acetyl-ADP-ribose deacetylase (regulator of RNase III)
MPITQYKEGNLLDAQEPFIAHGVNCMAVMGAGVALAIANKWPESELKYREFCWKHIIKQSLLGKSLATNEAKDKKVLFHMFIQYDTGTDTRKVNYGALARTFSELNNTLEVMRDFDEHMEHQAGNNTIIIPKPTVAIPKIGSGLAGGDWNIIEEIINGCTPDINIVVYELKV